MPDNVSGLIAANVRAEMARAGIYSARQLAERLDVNRGWVHRRLSCDVAFTVEDLALIAESLGVPLHRLYSSPDEPPGREPSARAS